MIFYSQTYEDILIYHILKERKDVFWVDVGANDPTRLSVTKFFSDGGGHGINIEPAKEYYKRLVAERKRDINLNIAVGSENKSKIRANVRPGGWLFNGDYRYFENEKRFNKTDIESTTLTAILDEYLPLNQEIHFLKIDIDGFEIDCLRGMEFDKYRPWCMCIEVSVSDEWEPIVLSNGYIRVWRDELNAYYADVSRMEMGDVVSIKKNSESIRRLYGRYDAYKYDDQIKQVVKLKEYPNKCEIISRILQLKSRGLSIVERIKSAGHQKAAVYGMSVIGERVTDECLIQDVSVLFGIDQNANIDRYDWDGGHIDVFTLDKAPLDRIDCIIVALVNDEEVVDVLNDMTSEKRIKVYTIKELL